MVFNTVNELVIFQKPISDFYYLYYFSCQYQICFKFTQLQNSRNTCSRTVMSQVIQNNCSYWKRDIGRGLARTVAFISFRLVFFLHQGTLTLNITTFQEVQLRGQANNRNFMINYATVTFCCFVLCDKNAIVFFFFLGKDFE